MYDVWVELWGQSFADEQVTIERARTGSLANYDKLQFQLRSEHVDSSSLCRNTESDLVSGEARLFW